MKGQATIVRTDVRSPRAELSVERPSFSALTTLLSNIASRAGNVRHLRGQATMELLLLFLVTLATIAIITPAILQAYSSMSGKSSAAMARAEVENEILAYEVYCNSMGHAPVRSLMPDSNTTIQVEEWQVIVGGSFRFSGIFQGCGYRAANKKFA